MKSRLKTTEIVVHCSDTPDNRKVTAEDIADMHLDRGWEDIGYHFVLERDGGVCEGREIDLRGAHVRGANHKSVGVCLVGRSKFTWMQLSSLKTLIEALLEEYKLPLSAVRCHYEYESAIKQGKTCPNIDKAHLYWFLTTGNLDALRENLDPEVFLKRGVYGQSRVLASSAQRGERGH